MLITNSEVSIQPREHLRNAIMKLTNLALLGAIFGPNATAATDAITGIDPRKRKLSSSQASSSSSTKSSKKSKGAGYNIDYPKVAAVILASLGCSDSECGNSCHTMNDEAVDALEAIATGGSLEQAWRTSADYRFGVCNSSLECITSDPFDEGGDFTVTHPSVLSVFSGAQDTCEDDSVPPIEELMALYGKILFRCIIDS